MLLLADIVDTMVPFRPFRPSQNSCGANMLLSWLLLTCLTGTASPICSKSSQVHIFLSTWWSSLSSQRFLSQAKSICVPKDYVKFELPPESPTVVNIGIDIKDIPKVEFKEILKLHHHALHKGELKNGVKCGQFENIFS